MTIEDSAVIFDLDGTLIDSRQDLANAVNAVRADIGVPPLPLGTVVSFVGDGAKNLLIRSLGDLPDADLAHALTQFHHHYMNNLTRCTRLYANVHEGLVTLRDEGYQLAVATNKPAAATVEILSHFKLTPLFSAIIGGGDLPLKPDPAALIHILKQTGCKAEKSWMVGDHRTDLSAARSAGLKSIYAEYGFGNQGGLTPDFSACDFNTVVSILLTE